MAQQPLTIDLPASQEALHYGAALRKAAGKEFLEVQTLSVINEIKALLFFLKLLYLKQGRAMENIGGPQ
jgi:hypothetical protein